jgi:hypothetical protein
VRRKLAPRVTAIVAALLAVCGCARVVPERPEPVDCRACEELDVAPVSTASEGGAPRSEVASRSITVEGDERFATKRIGAGGGDADDGSSKRPRRTRRIDVELVRAPFEDAVRFLADSGRFNVVVEAASASDVTVSLRDVEPYDALEVIAEAKGLAVRMRRGIVVVSPSTKAP